MKRQLVRAAALLAIAACTALAQEPSAGGRRELIYGAELMTGEERAAYRQGMQAEKNPAAQRELRERHQQQLRERARARGVELKEPHGVLRTPRK